MKKLITVVILVLVTLMSFGLYYFGPEIDLVLKNNAETLLKAHDHQWATVSVTDRDLVVRGAPETASDRDDVLVVLDGVWWLSSVIDETTLNESMTDALVQNTTEKLSADTVQSNISCDNVAQLLELNTIYYAVGQSQLNDQHIQKINSVAKRLKDCPEVLIRVEGHADSQGQDSINLTLSEKRAKQVMDIMLNSGIDFHRVSYIGYGETKSYADSSSKVGHAKNRKTEFKIYNEE